MILSNVELYWAKLGTRIDNGFDGNTPAWAVDVRTKDTEVRDSWMSQGLNVKTKEDDGHTFYSVGVKKPTHTKDGKEQTPPTIVDKAKEPFTRVDSIGNGTTANVKLYTFDYDYKGKKGRGFRLDAIQILELRVYDAAPSDVFDHIDKTDIFGPNDDRPKADFDDEIIF